MGKWFFAKFAAMIGNNAPSWLRNIPPVTRNLLIINIGLWIVGVFMPQFNETILDRLGLHFWGAEGFYPFQLITYMFLQAPMSSSSGIAHIFFNMWALYMFGRIMEMTWGAKRYLIFYMVCGIGAGLVQECVWQLTWHSQYVDALAAGNHVSVREMTAYLAEHAGEAEWVRSVAGFKDSMLTIGASGAIFGLLLGFGCVFPNVPMYIMFIPVPIKAKWLVAGYGLLELYLGTFGIGGSVAHFAHLGGMLFAAVMIWWWHHKGTLHGRSY